MSSYFDEASLVMIPSGYKDQKVYSIKPLDGAGDLAFSRASSATRVASNGLIEKVRTNLALRSQSFATSAVWSTVSGTITDNAGTAPDGTNTASKIVAGNSDPYVYQSLTPSGQVTLSCYVKGVGSSIGKIARILCASDFTDVTMDGTWQRIKVTHTASGSELYGLEVPNPAATSDEVLMWGFQVEAGDIATDYIATTSAAVSVGPVSGLPRLDYLNSTCPRLLLEPQRTNTALYSEQFTNAVWVGSASTVVDNQAASPDGYTNADLLYPATSGNFAGKYQNLAAGTTGVLSCYVKQAGKRFAQLGTDNNATYTCAFDLQLGTVVRTATNYTGTITSVGNGWYRITAAYVSSAGAVYPFIGVSDNAAGAVTVDGTNGLYIYGFQYETSASYATSYIPTLGTSVTRVADAASKTGISSLIGQTEGTIFLDVKAQLDTTDQQDFSISDGTTNNRAIVRLTNSGIIQAVGVFGGNVEFSIGSGAYVTGQRYKIALAYKLNDVALYVNGVQSATDTSATISGTLSRLGFDIFTSGAQIVVSPVNQALLFKTRLTNESLAELTSL